VSWKIHPLAEFDEFAGDWTRICGEHYQSHPLLDLKFLRPLLKHFADDGVVVAVDRDARCVQSLLFVQRKRWGVWETFAPAQLPVCPAVTRRTDDWLGGWRELLHALPGYAGMLAALRYDPLYYPGLAPGGDRLEVVDYATTMSIGADGEFSDYWRSRRKKLRDNVSRYFRRLHSEHREYRFEEVTERESVEKATIEYGDLESAGWKGRRGTALHSGNVQGRFYSDALANFSEEANARVFRLFAGERLVASRLALMQNGILVFLKTAYDESYARCAPGRLLLFLVLEKLFETAAVRTAEFYTNANRDLLEWCTDSRPIQHVNIYRSRVVQGCIQLRRRLQNRLASRTVG